MTAEKKKLIDNFLDYIEQMVRRSTSRLTKLGVQKLIQIQRTKNNYSDDDENSPMAEFNT